MPQLIKFPGRTEAHCEPCEFHNCTGEFHVHCGEGGWREYACGHPDAHEISSDPWIANIQGKMAAFSPGGRAIGKTDKQPEWCPLKRKPEAK